MGRLPLSLLLLTCICIIQVEVSAQPPYYTLVSSIQKDQNTSLYSINLNDHDHYVIDINAPYSWFVCRHRHLPVACTSPQCIQGRAELSGLCPSNNTLKNGQCTCNVTPVNPVTNMCASSQLTFKSIIIAWTHGKYPSVRINFNNLYLSCAPIALLQGLPRNAIGIAALSWSPLAFSSQITPAYLGVTKKFAICLPSSPRAPGVIFFGDGPYYLMPLAYDISTTLSYTPLIRKNTSREYYIGVEKILIHGNALDLQANTFDFDTSGNGGVMLSTVVPYTILRSDIYKAFFKEFTKATAGYPRVKKVNPFRLCFNSTALGSTRMGLPVPQIDLELGGGTSWTIFGANSMKQVGKDVACLSFLDGGKTAEQAVVIGSYQMENNFLVFDLNASRLGFSSSLFFYRTTCGNFNFTSDS